jgi:hypothetical protein
VAIPFLIIFLCFRLLYAQDFMLSQTNTGKRLTASVSGRKLHWEHPMAADPPVAPDPAKPEDQGPGSK